VSGTEAPTGLKKNFTLAARRDESEEETGIVI
jgi:hypothetical protein